MQHSSFTKPNVKNWQHERMLLGRISSQNTLTHLTMARFLQIAIIICFHSRQSFKITSFNSFSITWKVDSTMKFSTFKISYDFKVHPYIDVTSTCAFAAPIFTNLKCSTVYVKIFYIDISRISGHKYGNTDTSSARPLSKVWLSSRQFSRNSYVTNGII
jgi:hypothetical protein